MRTTRLKLKSNTALLSLLVLLCLPASLAQAWPHLVIYNYVAPIPALELVSLSPQDHQAFEKAPATATASFTEAIFASGSDLKVYDPYNNPISGPVIMSKDTAMTVSLPSKLYAGSYRIEWKATCACQGAAVVSGTTYFTVY